MEMVQHNAAAFCPIHVSATRTLDVGPGRDTDQRDRIRGLGPAALGVEG